MIKNSVLVMLGGAIGCALRYLWDYYDASELSLFFCNAVGAFLIGLLYEGFKNKLSQRLIVFLGTGVLGGLTSFSALAKIICSAESAWISLAVALVTLVTGLLAVYLGAQLGKRVKG